MHPTLSGKAFQFFRCRNIEGTSYLMADYQIHCYTPQWDGFLILVVLFILVFSVGLPLAVTLLLIYNRGALQKDGFKRKFGIFYGAYKPGVYWFESVTITFKLALWITLVLFDHGSEMQLVTSLVITILNLCIHIEF